MKGQIYITLGAKYVLGELLSQRSWACSLVFWGFLFGYFFKQPKQKRWVAA